MQDPSEHAFHPSFWRLVVVQLLAGFCTCVFYLLPKFLTVELGATPSEVGLLNAAFGLSSVISVPLLGVALDRRPPSTLIGVGAAVLALAAAGYVWVDRMGPLVLLLRAAQGLAWALLFTAGMTLATHLCPPHRLTQGIGYFGAASLGMNAVAPATAEILADWIGWKVVFVLAAVVGSFGLVVARRLPHDGAFPRARSIAMSALLRRPASAWMVVVVTLWGAAFGAMFTFHQPFALELGIPHVRGFFIAYTMAALLARLGAGGFTDRIGRRRISVGALTLYALVVFAMQWLRPGWLEVFGAVFGLAHGLFFPSYSALTVERSPLGERGKLMALSNGGFNAGFAASGVVFGAIAERAGYPTVFLVSGAATLVGVAVLIFERAAAAPATSSG